VLTVPANSVVRYGVTATDRFIEKTGVSGSFFAGNGYFGSDPAVGIEKNVYLRSTP
jgi:hypothetical protein